MKLWRNASILLLLLLACFLWKKSAAPAVFYFTGIAMTIPYHITIGEPLTAAQKEEIKQSICAVFTDVDTRFNQWNPDSELSLLNELPGQETIEISHEMAHFLALIDSLVALTEGRFDPTIGPACDLWIPALKKGEIPSIEAQEAAFALTGWKKLRLDGSFVSKEYDGVRLNVDSVAKGHAVDLLTSALSKLGIKHFLVEWGGEFCSAGEHPDKRPWTVLIHGIESCIALQGHALATSGDYYQQWTLSTESAPLTYCHILDPATAAPVEVREETIASASICTDNCATADALATALMTCKNEQEAIEWIKRVQKSKPDIAAWIATRKEGMLTALE